MYTKLIFVIAKSITNAQNISLQQHQYIQQCMSVCLYIQIRKRLRRTTTRPILPYSMICTFHTKHYDMYSYVSHIQIDMSQVHSLSTGQAGITSYTYIFIYPQRIVNISITCKLCYQKQFESFVMYQMWQLFIYTIPRRLDTCSDMQRYSLLSKHVRFAPKRIKVAKVDSII